MKQLIAAIAICNLLEVNAECKGCESEYVADPTGCQERADLEKSKSFKGQMKGCTGWVGAIPRIDLHKASHSSLEIEKKGNYEYVPWETVREQAAILYDFEELELNHGWSEIQQQLPPHDGNSYYFYTGIGLEIGSDTQHDRFCDCFYYRHGKKYVFATMYPDPTKATEPKQSHHFNVKKQFKFKFQNTLLQRIEASLKKRLNWGEKSKPETGTYVFTVKVWQDVGVSITTTRPIKLTNMPTGQKNKYAWLQWKGVQGLDAPQLIVKKKKGVINYGQVEFPNIHILPSASNALDIRDAHEYPLFSRKLVTQKGWRPNEFLQFDDLEFFEHIEGTKWKREHYGVDQWWQEIELFFDNEGVFSGWGAVSESQPIKSVSVYESESPVDSSYQSVQGKLGDCQRHATNTLLRGPFFTNKDFQKFGKPVTKKGGSLNSEQFVLNKKGQGEAFGNVVVTNAIATVGCGMEDLTTNWKQKVANIEDHYGASNFLGLKFTYYHHRISKKEPHVIGLVYKEKNNVPGYWWIQSWEGDARRWWSKADTIKNLEEWSTAPKNIRWGFKVYQWYQLHAMFIVDKTAYMKALGKAQGNDLYKVQYPDGIRNAFMEYLDIYEHENGGDDFYDVNYVEGDLSIDVMLDDIIDIVKEHEVFITITLVIAICGCMFLIGFVSGTMLHFISKV